MVTLIAHRFQTDKRLTPPEIELLQSRRYEVLDMGGNPSEKTHYYHINRKDLTDLDLISLHIFGLEFIERREYEVSD